MKYIKLIVPIYKTAVHVIIGTVPECKSKSISLTKDPRQAQVFRDANEEAYDGYTWETVDTGIVIWFPNMSDEIILHEFFHATCSIMNMVGIKLSEDSEEAYAYLHGWLYSNFIKLYKKS